jgi:hypothetical protein
LFAKPNPLFRRFNNLLGTHSAIMQQMPYYPPGYQAPSPYGSSHLMQADNGLPQLPHPVGVGEPNTASSGHGAKRKQVKNACSKFFLCFSMSFGIVSSRCTLFYSTLNVTSHVTPCTSFSALFIALVTFIMAMRAPKYQNNEKK